MITQISFNNSIEEYDKREPRTSVFALASNLIKNGYEIESFILLLATWNFARFRYAIKEFDIDNLLIVLNKIKSDFDLLNKEDISTIDLPKYKDNIINIYCELSKIKGIEFTGAPKLMHLKCPKLFVMWDDFIRGSKPKKYYQELEIVKKNEWLFKRYSKKPEDYYHFLCDMQYRFKNMQLANNSITLAKAIDEFNYVNITLPMQKLLNNIKKKH